MTKVISFVNSKGGAGKTTLAFTLATLWDRQDKHVLLVDCDPQASLTTLFGVRENKGNMEAMPVALGKLEARIAKEIASEAHDLILIDTPGNLSELKPAISVADLIVIPVQASGADYFSFKRVFNLCESAKKQTVLVPNRVKTQRDAESIPPTLSALCDNKAVIGMPVGDRVNHRQWTVEGLSIVDIEPVSSRGMKEIAWLAKQLEDLLNGKTKKRA